MAWEKGLKMQTIKLTTGETIHDFRPQKLGWGWNGLTFQQTKDKKAKMLGIGKGLKAGDYIAVRNGDDDIAHKIESIKYKTNPEDMFEAILTGTYEFESGELDNAKAI